MAKSKFNNNDNSKLWGDDPGFLTLWLQEHIIIPLPLCLILYMRCFLLLLLLLIFLPNIPLYFMAKHLHFGLSKEHCSEDKSNFAHLRYVISFTQACIESCEKCLFHLPVYDCKYASALLFKVALFCVRPFLQIYISKVQAVNTLYTGTTLYSNMLPDCSLSISLHF